MRRRVLFVGRSRYTLPLTEGLARKWDALAAVLDVRVLASAAPGSAGSDARFRLVRPLPVRALDGPVFWMLLCVRVLRELRRRPVDAVVAQSPFEALAVLAGRRLAGSRAALVIELHGDWRTFARQYGSRTRVLVAPVADRAAAWALRRADAVRAVSPFLADLARGAGADVADVYTTYTDVAAFSGEPLPLPDVPALVSVGVLERYKNVDGIAAAWRLAAPQVPGARLRLVGRGPLQPLVEELVRELPGRVEWVGGLSQPELARALDQAWALLLPSRSEGLPRVAIEAFRRGRPVIGGRAGGIPDIVEHGRNGLLVDPEDPAAIAGAMVRVLSDRGLAERLAAGARVDAARWTQTPDEHAARTAALVERAIAP